MYVCMHVQRCPVLNSLLMAWFGNAYNVAVRVIQLDLQDDGGSLPEGGHTDACACDWTD